MSWWRALFGRPVTTRPAPAPSHPLPTPVERATPLTADRVAAVVRARGYHVRSEADGSVTGLWEGFRFQVRLTGPATEFLSVRGSWGRTLPAAMAGALAQAVNDWNRDKVWPTVFTVPSGDGIGVRTEVLTDVGAGATDRQLLELIEGGLAAGVQFFQALDRSVPVEPTAE
ncbi:YbjN domain-containing protein [Georgenia sp. TF02-10]|uniref:YbjN domain-containing protein n=1 Tax=Georgenia sp. TF02-10 TaxID=2917725 RepID=UPI001FA7C9B0|nr:YbjN domain-containing protein [Georgenia sp. TF02-10]UNX55948.1 YbjN domain-containing protein [Georgenia sp. TF02-10]